MNTAALQPWGGLLLAALVVVALTQVAHRLLRPIVVRVAAFSPVLLAIVRRGDAPVQLAAPLVIVQLALQSVPDTLPGIDPVEHLFSVLTICAFTWLAMEAL